MRATIAGASILLATGLAPGAAAEEAPREQAQCPVVAAAQGVQVTASKSDDLFLQAPTGVSAPVAQSCVNYGLQESQGFASSPYPGETVIAVPGLLAGQTGAPVPPYPAYVSSTYPAKQESGVSKPGYSLSSQSDQTSSRSRARSGLAQDQAGAGVMAASAEATVTPTEGTSDARAVSRTAPVTINDVLQLGTVRSLAAATVDADGQLLRESRLRVGHSSVGGQEVMITPEGVKLAGETIGAPKQADPNDVLAQAGVRVRYLEKEKTSRGVLSAGIEVVAEQQDPNSGATYTVHHTFGRAFAAAAEVTQPSADEVTGMEIPTVSGGGAGAAEAEPSIGDAKGVRPAAAGPEAAQGRTAPKGAEAPAVAAAPQEAKARLAGEPVDMGMAGVYLMIVFAGLATVVGGTLLRLLGVRTRWIS